MGKKTWAEVDSFCMNTYGRTKELVRDISEHRLISALERADGSKRPLWQSIADHALSHMASHIALV